VEPDAVVFDLDGVLLDSEQLWDEARRSVAAEHGVPWPPEATEAMQGMSTPEWSDYLVERVGVGGSPTDVAREVIGRMTERYRRELPLLPGAVPAVQALSDHWPLGLASSSPPQLIQTALEAAGLADRFRAVVSSEQVARGKPAPDVYLATAAALGVSAAGCLAVEDSANGLRAAAAAGMAVVAVPNRHYAPPGEALRLAAAVVGTVAEVTPELVATLPVPATEGSSGSTGGHAVSEQPEG
jgi:HAD superfamily hydrolase (TIGR01509 family)